MRLRRARVEDFTVGWICALHIELTAAREALDEEYERIDDVAHYTLGRIGRHNVAIACLPAGQLGTSSAAAVAADMRKTFRALEYGLVVGIAGGVPSKRADVRLGDVVISHPQGLYGGVVQYDFVKIASGGKQIPNGILNSPHSVLLQAVAAMRSAISTGRTNLQSYLSPIAEHELFCPPDPGTDNLFDPSYEHVPGDACEGCLEDKIVERPARTSRAMTIHYGIVASGNQVVKDGLTRDRISEEHGGVFCFEMEAAGLMNIFPCLIIRGICDYADSHKNKGWQPFAAASAAACAKAVLSFVPATSQTASGGSSHTTSIITNRTPIEPSKALEANESRSGLAGQDPAETDSLDPSLSYTKSELTEAQREHYHKSLKFEEIDARHATIQDAHYETCWWFLDSQEYRDWLDLDKLPNHHGFLWIKGNPGTGKSTIMKFALASTRKRMADSIVINFFFNARGNDLEKSVLGMYRSLLFQLIYRVPHLGHVFSLLRPKKLNSHTVEPAHDQSNENATDPACQPQNELAAASSHVNVTKPTADRTTYMWDIGTLQSLFGHAVKRLGRRPLLCFIDALDECDEDQIREMVAFFEQLSDLAASSRIELRTCFSSRHYPTVTISHGISLVLEHQEGHKDDIVKYVDSKLNGVRSKLLNEVKREICARSSEIFLWVVLVVQILKKDFDRGQIHEVKKRLEEIPDGLDDLFDDILTRDTQNVERLILCIQWVLFARRPLEPIELFYAILVGERSDALAQLDPADVDKEALQRFVLDSSKGLTEVTKGVSNRVQFIHESVRDYLLKTNCLQRLRAELAFNFPGASEERLKRCCQDYIKIIVPPNESPETYASSLAAKGRGQASSTHPFLEYAVKNILSHADVAAEHGLPQNDFLAEFPHESWIILRELMGHYWYDTHYEFSLSLIYILANQNLTNLVHVEAKRTPFIDVSGGYHGDPLNAAKAHRSAKLLNALLVGDNDVLPNNGTIQKAALYVTTEDRDAAIQDLLELCVGDRLYDVQYNPDMYIDGECIRELHFLPRWSPRDEHLLPWAARNRKVELLKMLLNTEKLDIDSPGGRGRTALLWATIREEDTIAKLLLDTGKAAVNCKDRFGRTPLACAAGQGYITLVQMLTETGEADMNTRDVRGRTPLSVAAGCGHEAVVKLLLATREVDVDTKDMQGRTPLLLAAGRGHAAIVKLLLDTDKVDVNTQDVQERTPLLLAARGGQEVVIKLLLETGKVDIEFKDSDGRTTMSWAATWAVRRLLFDFWKADMTLKGKPLDLPKLGLHPDDHALLQAECENEPKLAEQTQTQIPPDGQSTSLTPEIVPETHFKQSTARRLWSLLFSGS